MTDAALLKQAGRARRDSLQALSGLVKASQQAWKVRMANTQEGNEPVGHRAARQEAWIKEGRASSWQRTATSPASKQQRSVAAERRELERRPQTVSI